jgi:hypothetical protein
LLLFPPPFPLLPLLPFAAPLALPFPLLDPLPVGGLAADWACVAWAVLATGAALLADCSTTAPLASAD